VEDLTFLLVPSESHEPRWQVKAVTVPGPLRLA
jgi:hypothetical protein